MIGALSTGGQRFDLPLESSAASRFLVWILGGLVYLMVLAFGIAAVADQALDIYQSRARLVTVTLPPVDDPTQDQEAVAAALAVLEGAAGVISAAPVSAEELEQLIEPWIGAAAERPDLPLPRLIDVTLDPVHRPDLEELQGRLEEAVPGATIGVEALSRDRAERLAAYVRAWAGAAGLLLLGGAVAAAAMLTRQSLAMLTDTVELLRLMGAPDRYIARQFESHALLSALRGGLIGFALALLTLVAMLWSSRRMELAGAIELDLSAVHWVLLAAVPPVTAVLVALVVRLTAVWRLGRS
jgi:cell division transport system permease protein